PTGPRGVREGVGRGPGHEYGAGHRVRVGGELAERFVYSAMCPDRLGSTCRADPHRLDVHELPDAERGQLPAIPTALDAAEGQARVGGYHAVDEDCSSLDLPGEFFPIVNVAGPQVCAETIDRMVRHADSLGRVTRTHD